MDGGDADFGERPTGMASRGLFGGRSAKTVGVLVVFLLLLFLGLVVVSYV